MLRKSATTLSGKKSKSGKRESLTKTQTDLTSGSPSYIKEFLKNFDQNDDECVPTIIIQNKVITNGRNAENLPGIHINYVPERLYSTIKCTNNRINGKLLAMIKNHFINLKELRLEYCGLSSDHLSDLQKILQENPKLIYLSIDGNRINIEDFTSLFHDNNLRIISMQLCEFDGDAGSLIAEELIKPDSKIISLNLASNYLEDSGAKSLAKSLRSNRILKALNIADNKISEEGLLNFFKVFQAFPLNMDEIILRRRMIYQCLSKKDQIQSLPSKQSVISLNKKTSESSRRPKKTDTSSRKSSNKSLDVDLKSLVETCNHPFVNDSNPINNEIICNGNDSLRHLNIAYNKITEALLENIKQFLIYQKNTENDEMKGLARIIIEGNGIEKYSSLLEEIHQLKTNKQNSNASFKRRNSSLI